MDRTSVLSDFFNDFIEEDELTCYSDNIICKQCGVSRDALIRYLSTDKRFIILGKKTKQGTMQILPKRAFLRIVLNICLKAFERGIRTVSSEKFFSSISDMMGMPLTKQDERILMKHANRYSLAAFSNKYELFFPAITMLRQMPGEPIDMFKEKILELFDLDLTNKSLEGMIKESFNSFFEYFIPSLKKRNIEIIQLRMGLKGGKKHTLEEAGSSYGITRERVRQIENTFQRKLDLYMNRGISLLPALLLIFMKHKGKRIYSMEDSLDLHRLLFICKIHNMPITKMKDYNLYFLGCEREIVSKLEELFMQHACIDREQTFCMIDAIKDLYLTLEEKEFAAGLISTKVRQSIRWEDLIRIAMGIIGRPAHYTEIATVCKELIPEKDVTPRLVLAVLARSPKEQEEEDGFWVWTGARGVYALKEWGYSRPSLSIFDTVCEIVNNIYSQTGKPVSLNTIYAEIGKYRQVINRNSVNIACYCHQNLIAVDKDHFIPGKPELNIDEEDYKELDDVLRGLDHLLD